MATICLITQGQPSTNPRLVKEADALVEAGHEVHVVCVYVAAWAGEADEALLESRRFSCTYVGGHPEQDGLRHLWTRARHKAGRAVARYHLNDAITTLALCRVVPELTRAAKKIKADLYIAHNLGALPAAVRAGNRNRARVGFDAEDFHSGSCVIQGKASVEEKVTDYTERRYLSRCDYITAASPLIAEAYEARYGVRKPTTILNVFPLSERPAEFRASDGRSALTLYWFSQTIGADRGLEDVVQAMGKLQGYDIELHLRGKWQQGYRERLLQSAATAGMRPEQIVHHDPAPPDHMIQLAGQYDIGLAVEPGRDENNRIAISNKLFTYLLAGCAVIATNTAGQRSIIEEIGLAGFGYEPGDVTSLATALKNWFENREYLEAARHAAWEWGTRMYNWDREKKKFLALIESVLESPVGQSA